MDFELLVVRGRSSSQALKLVDGITTIGRQDDCHLRIKSSSVSRKHCELFEKKGMLLVKDLGSSNGTIVNGKKISGQQVLEPGDELTIGGIKLKVAKIGHAPPSKPSPAPAPASPPPKAQAKPAPAAKSDDDFDIDFDSLPDAVTLPEEEEDAVVPDVDGFEIPLDEEPSPPPPPPPPPPPRPHVSTDRKPIAATTKVSKPSPPPPKDAAPDGADEAIADFLLDLKLDD